MNESISISQAMPKRMTKFDQLYKIVENSNLSMLAACVEAVLMESAAVFDEQRGDNPQSLFESLLNITKSYLFDVNQLLENACCIYSLVEFNLIKRMANDLNEAICSSKESNLNDEFKSNLIHGLCMYAGKLREKIDLLGGVLEVNKELLND